MGSFFAIIKLILKILSIIDTIEETRRLAWINDLNGTFDNLKKAKTSEEKSKAASDIAKLIRGL